MHILKRLSNKAESQDAAALETAMVDLGAEYKDRDGNCVAYGDMSMQRVVENTRTGTPKAYASSKKDF